MFLYIMEADNLDQFNSNNMGPGVKSDTNEDKNTYLYAA